MAVLVSVTGAGAWKFLRSFPTPGPEPRGFTAYSSGVGLVVQDDLGGSYIYVIETYHGSIITSFAAPGGRGTWGVSQNVNPGYLYISNYRTSWIHYITTAGSVLGSYRCPVGGPADMEIDTYRYYRLHVAIPDSNVIVVLDRTTGSLVSSYAGPGTRPTSCGGYRAVLIADADVGKIYLKEYGWIISGFDTPTGVGSVESLDCQPFAFVYVVDAGKDMIYVWGTDTCGVSPASLGRVKALFR
jgi:hypothetical protein